MTIETQRDRQVQLTSLQRLVHDLLKSTGALASAVDAAVQDGRAELTQTAVEEMSLRTPGLPPAQPPKPRAKPKPASLQTITDDDARDAVIELAPRFSLSHYRAYLGCTLPEARDLLKREPMASMVQRTSNNPRDPDYEYVAPEGAGAAAEGQRRLRVVDATPGGDLALAGSGAASASLLRSVADKKIREAARQAISQGWTLERTGHSSAGHVFQLTHPGCLPLKLPSTPRNSHDAAQNIRQGMRRRLAHAS